VLRRTAVPDDEAIALSHIAIKYSGCSGWRRLERPVLARTREQARELAGEIAESARQARAAAFDELARRYSESGHALRAGDMASYTQHENMDSELRGHSRGARAVVCPSSRRPPARSRSARSPSTRSTPRWASWWSSARTRPAYRCQCREP